MQKIKKFLFLPAITILLLSSCMKQENFPDTPQIEYNNFVLLFDSGLYAPAGVLSVNFTDGNGDIGLGKYQNDPPFDSGSPYHYNFIIDFYEKINGEFVKNPTINFNSRIPVLNSTEPGKAIKGIINEELPMSLYPEHDTIRFEAFIYDRALNKSNVIVTPPIILRRY